MSERYSRSGSPLAGMGDVINLRQARKQKQRQLAEQQVAANRARHGRRKSERELNLAQAAKDRRDLDRLRIDRRDEP